MRLAEAASLEITKNPDANPDFLFALIHQKRLTSKKSAVAIPKKIVKNARIERSRSLRTASIAITAPVMAAIMAVSSKAAMSGCERLPLNNWENTELVTNSSKASAASMVPIRPRNVVGKK